MREEQPLPGDEHPEAATPQEHGALVVLSSTTEPIARASLWLRSTHEHYILVAIPRLRLEQGAALQLAGGSSYVKLFRGAILVTPHWTHPADFVGGSFQLWKRAEPLITECGFVIGKGPSVDAAVRGVVKLLRGA